MQAGSRSIVAIYVDRPTRQWVVRDPEGRFWALPSTDAPWEGRVPFEPSDETDLEPVPGHYKYMLGLCA
jgi:hypothetical protein